MAQAEQIYCPKCKTHLYTTAHKIETAVKLEAKDFLPVDGISKPIEEARFVCPIDGAPLNGYEYWFWSRSRKEPRMAYNAITLLVKDENGKLVWKPEEVILDDF